MAFFIYLAQVSLYAAIMWAIYAIVWRNSSLHRYSRFYLLASLLLPVVLPFIHLPAGNHSFTATYQVMLPEINIGAATVHQTAEDGLPWKVILPGFYTVVGVILSLLYLQAYLRISNKLKRGHANHYDKYTLITETGIGPGTLGRKIFFPASDADPVILRHELAHIQAGHRYDAFLLQLLHVLLWASPAHWLLGRELKMVHEFEADRIACRGLQAQDYASLLLSQSLGLAPTLTIAHSFFHHPLKRRIMMLQEIKAPKKSILLFTTTLLTAAFMSTVLIAQIRKPAKSLSKSRQGTTAPVNMDNIRLRMVPKNGEVKLLNDGTIAFKTVEQMPEFNGDLGQWLSSYLHYPDSARARGEEGRSIVQFTVSEQGQILSPHIVRSSGHSKLDEEALRAVRGMPHWHPGILKGKPVSVIFHLPITFRLEGGKQKEGC